LYDVNNVCFRKLRPPREPFEQIRIVAGKTADTAFRAYEKVAGDHEKVIRLGMIEREITLKVRMPTPEQVKQAERVTAMSDKEAESLPGLAEAYAVRTLNHVKAADTVDIKIQAVRIGDLAIVTFPFEVFAETGLDLKEKSPFGDTFVMEQANGAQGYLPTPGQHKLGGYETWLTTNRVQLDASEVISRNLLEMLADLKKQ
jgi:neutral ceramidase